MYSERRRLLEGQDFREQALKMVEETVASVVASYCPHDVYPEDWDMDAMLTGLNEIFPVTSTKQSLEGVRDVAELQGRFQEEAIAAFEAKELAVTAPVMRDLERVVLLNITDTKWREHLYEMDYLQEGIHLRSYAQQDPLTEYRREAFEMFEELSQSIREDFVRYIYRVDFVRPEVQQAKPQKVHDNRAEVESLGLEESGADQAVSDKTPRNAPCPCGSGRKYKKCHGAVV
jgi:preprotein translocase subunit SecA